MLIENNTFRVESPRFSAPSSRPSVSAVARRELSGATGARPIVRDADDRTIGMIGNGCIVQELRDGADDNGRPWVFVATLDGHPVGWVYRELISYN